MKYPEQPKYDIEKSPIRDVYKMLGAATPLEMLQKYDAVDQALMLSKEWDYTNASLLVNQVRVILEKEYESIIDEDEKYWAREILWFWYHHGISCAIWKYKDKKQARIFADQALQFQSEGHPNKITKLLYFLVNDRLEEAQQWALTITDEVEGPTAQDLVREYPEIDFNV